MIELTPADVTQVDGAACQEACCAPFAFEVEPLKAYELPLLPDADDFAIFNAQ
jgi:hypothetical protein